MYLESRNLRLDVVRVGSSEILFLGSHMTTFSCWLTSYGLPSVGVLVLIYYYKDTIYIALKWYLYWI
jgi:hypothetical protein